MSLNTLPEAAPQSVRAASEGERVSVRSLRLVAGLLLAFASGLLAVVINPPGGWWPCLFVAFVPMLVAQHRVLPRSLSGLAPGVAIACLFSGQLSAGLAQGEVAWYIELWPVYVAFLIAALAARSASFHERTRYRWFLLSFPAAWVAIEYLREASGVDFLAATFGNPVYALYEQYWLLQPISIFGLFGLLFLVLVTNFAVARLLLSVWDVCLRGRADWRPSLVGLASVAMLWVGWLALSWQLLDASPTTLRVAAIQPNAPLDPEEEYRRDLAMSRVAAAQGAELIVWREAGLRFDPQRERTAELQALARESGAYLVLGYQVPTEKGRLNEAAVLTPAGEFLGSYGKAHPGTFAGDYSDNAGKSYPVYDTAIGMLSTIICYDLDFLDTARRMARGGAEIVAVPSADVPALAHVHYTHLVFRAIENRLPMIKADNLFDSAVIDPWGRIVALNINPLSPAEAAGAAESNSIPAQLLVADVPLSPGRPPLVALGEWVGLLCLIASLGFLWIGWRSRGAGTASTDAMN